MRQVVSLYGAVVICGGVLALGLGPAVVVVLAYGALALMAGLIALTFFWLWLERATPLALGMSVSWAGSGLIMGWWALQREVLLALGPGEAAGLTLLLALLITGAVLHFSVIQSTFGLSGLSFLWLVSASFALSCVVFWLM